MNFGQSISTCFSKYAVFTGRARRSEYWWFYLFVAIAYAVAAAVDVGTNSRVGMVVVFVTLVLPTLAAGVRRLHDTGRSGWFLLINVIPLIGPIVVLILDCQDSGENNKYGPNPKYLGYRQPGYAVWG